MALTVFSKEFFTGRANGLLVQVATTATPGTLIHTAVAGTDDSDEIYLYAANNSAASRLLTIEFGGVTSADIVEVNVPARAGLFLVVPGASLQNGLIVRAFAAVANVINIVGWVNRINVP